jgi:hypothetical protein
VGTCFSDIDGRQPDFSERRLPAFLTSVARHATRKQREAAPKERSSKREP